jgi:diguanylate cyclase (GGDEF)-like protein
VRYAVERSRLKEQLPRLAFLDDLTGLCNRRGFFLLAEHQLRMARRSKRNLLMLFVDLDGLKQINDTLGHREGDLALRRTAEVLCTTFRASDVVGRLGGDEFVVLTWEDSGQSAQAAVKRLLRRVEKANASGSCRHTLSLSVGVARFDPARMSSLEELMAKADGALYGQKRSKHDATPPPMQTTSQVPVPCTS